MVRLALRRRIRGVQEPLVAHVAFTAAEENVWTLLPLHTLVTVKDMEVEMKKKPKKHTYVSSLSTQQTAEDMGVYFLECK